VSDVVNYEYIKQNTAEFIEDAYSILRQNRIETLAEWSQLSSEQKGKYPDFLVTVLDNACQKAFGSDIMEICTMKEIKQQFGKLQDRFRIEGIESDMNRREQFTMDTFVNIFNSYASATEKNRENNKELLYLEDICNALEKEIKVPKLAPLFNSSIQQEKLSKFNNPSVQLPIINGNIAMDKTTLNPALWTDDVKNYVEAVTSHRLIDIHMKISGAGKTARIMSIATNIYTTYISGDTRTTKNDDPTYAYFFDTLQTMTPLDRVLNLRREIVIFYLARFLYLKILMRGYIGLTPTDYFLCQSRSETAMVYRGVRSYVERYNLTEIHSILRETIQSCSVQHAFVIDETQAMASHLDG
jgi:hypothetical protein